MLDCGLLSAWAEPVANALTLEQALQIAIQNNPHLKAVRAELGIAEAAIKTANARINPSIMSDNGVAEKTYRLGVAQIIELGGKRRKRVSLASAQRDVAMSDINVQWLELRNSVRRAYAQAYNAQERQQNYEIILHATDEMLALAHQPETRGQFSDMDILQTEIASVNAQNDLQVSIQERVITRNQLNNLLNQPLGTSIPLAAPNLIPSLPLQPQRMAALRERIEQLPATVNAVDMGDVDDLLEDAYQNRPEIQRIQQQFQVIQKEMTLVKAQRIPDLQLTIGPDLVVEPGQRQFNVFVIGNMEVPVFNRQQGPIQEAVARRFQLEQEQLALRNQVAVDVTNAYTAFQMSLLRLKRYEKQLLPYSKEVLAKSLQVFKQGKTPILMPLQARQAYINTQFGYLQTLLDLQNAISDLEKALGMGL